MMKSCNVFTNADRLDREVYDGVIRLFGSKILRKVDFQIALLTIEETQFLYRRRGTSTPTYINYTLKSLYYLISRAFFTYSSVADPILMTLFFSLSFITCPYPAPI